MLKAGVPLPAVEGKMRQEGMSEQDVTAVTGTGGGGGGGGGGNAGGGIITTTNKLGSILFDRPLTVTMLMFVVIGAVYYWLKNSRQQGGRRKSYVSVIRQENKHV